MTATCLPWQGHIGTALLIAAAAAHVAIVAPAAAQNSTAQKPPSESVYRLERDALTLELAPLTREQLSAFLVGRGLTVADAALAAERGCFFRSAIGSTETKPGGPQVRIALGDWQVMPLEAQPSRLGLREDWDQFWSARKLAEAQTVAFHWALFPSQQLFAPTDHNWGFLSFMQPPGTQFSLVVAWQVDGTPHRARIEGLRCAP